MPTNTTMPPRVTTADVERIRRQAGEDSAVYARAVEQHAEWEAYDRQIRAENALLRDARLAKLDQEREQAREARTAGAEADLKAELRARFVAGNPTVSDAEFERLYPQLRDEAMIERTRSGRSGEQAALVARGGYGSL